MIVVFSDFQCSPETSGPPCHYPCSNSSGKQFAALLQSGPIRQSHPLGYHPRRTANGNMFEHIVESLVYSSDYDRTSSASCSPPPLPAMERPQAGPRAAPDHQLRIRADHRLYIWNPTIGCSRNHGPPTGRPPENAARIRSTTANPAAPLSGVSGLIGQTSAKNSSHQSGKTIRSRPQISLNERLCKGPLLSRTMSTSSASTSTGAAAFVIIRALIRPQSAGQPVARYKQ